MAASDWAAEGKPAAAQEITRGERGNDGGDRGLRIDESHACILYRTKFEGLYVEQEVADVAVVHDVVLAFDA
jgi:hypothetical protein